MNIKNLFVFKHLRAKILVVTMFVGLMPLLVVGGTLNWLFESNRYSVINENIVRHTQNISLVLEEYVESKILSVESIASMPSIKSAFSNYKEAITLFGPYSNQYQDVEDEYVDIIANVTEQNGFKDILFVSNDGRVVFSLLQGQYHGVNVYDSLVANSFQDIFINTNGSISSQVKLTGFEAEEGTREVYFSSPVFSDGIYIATVIAVVDVTEYFNNIENNGLLSNYSNISFYEKSDKDWVNVEYKHSANNQAEHDYPLEFNGVLNDFEAESIIPSLNLLLRVNYSEAYILAPLMHTRLVVLLFILSMAMIIALISSNVSGGITRPIKGLRESFKALSNGDKDVLIKSDLQDEVGDLLHQFNHMVKTLRDTESKLVESEKLVSIGNLAAGVAHEINNPMAIVTSNVSTIKEFSSELVEYLNKVDTVIEEPDKDGEDEKGIDQEDVNALSKEMEVTIDETSQALDRVKAIVSSMQVFSEVDKETKEMISINSLLDEIIFESKSDYPDAVIKNNYIKNVSLMGRKKQLKMAFSRLLDNAIKACDKQSIKISLHVGGTSEQAIICVDDRGCGVDARDRDKIFDPFFTTREVGQGIGLGLSIAYSIVSAHSGSISVQSVLGKGSRFKVAIPFSEA